MPKPPNVIRPTQLTVALPADIRARLDLHLWSDLERRVPHGAYAKFLTQLLREYFDARNPINSSPIGPPEETDHVQS